MNPETLALMIPIMALAIPIIAIWARHQQRLAELNGSAAPVDNAALAAQAERVRALEERVRVLERIVTDGGSNLAAEIEALRDTDAGVGVPLGLDRERA